MHSSLDSRHRHLESVLESLEDYVFELSCEGCIINGWASSDSKFYMPREAFLNKQLGELFPQDISGKLMDTLKLTLSTRAVQETEYQLPGDPAFYNARFHVMNDNDGVVVLVRDVTEFNKVKDQLEMNESRFRNLIKHSTDVFTIIQPDGIITYQSESFMHQFGHTESLVGKNILQFIHPDDHARIVFEIQRGVAKGGVSDFIEFRFQHADGRWIPIESRGNSLLNEPGIEGIVINSRDISERKQIEEQLVQNEARFRKLLQNSMDVTTVLNEKGEIVFDSFSIYTQFGYDQTLEGKSVFDFVHPDDVALAKEIFTNNLTKPGITDPVEFRFRASDGSWRNVEAIGNNLFEEPSIRGFVINSRDITERKSILKDLSMSNARIEAILESTNDVIFAFDTGYKYIAFNQAHKGLMKRLYNMDIEIGGSVLVENTSSEFDDKRMRILFERSLKGEQFTYVHELKNDSTFLLYNEISFNPIKDELGNVEGVAVFSKDITESKRSADELMNAKNEAIAAATAKSEFLSNMSHEIRTPMNAILGMTDLLIEKIKDPEAIEYLKSIKFSSDNLLVVINDILDFSKIEAGKVGLEQIDFDLRKKVNEIKKTFDLKANQKGLKFTVLVDEKIPHQLKGDPYRLNQILFNLIGNAIKFTHQGFISLEINKKDEENDWLKIEFVVKDSGIGIPEHKKETIFESFSQAYTDTTRKYGGTGLGLAITRRLVQLQGGMLQLESQSGVGTTFSVILPFQKTALSEIDATGQVLSQKDMLLKGVEILVVEDNVMNQFVAKQILGRWEAIATIASNGEEAIKMLSQKDFDVVLMDLQMPEMSGYEATRIIRAKDTIVRNPAIPIIALTADAFPETKRRVLETGMNDFVTKPFNRDDLHEKIARLCARNGNH